MKIVQELSDLVKDKESVHAEAKKKHEYHYVASVRHIRGLRLFAYNTVTNELTEPEIRSEAAVDVNGKPVFSNQANIDKNCLYVQALNRENALKKFKKIIMK